MRRADSRQQRGKPVLPLALQARSYTLEGMRQQQGCGLAEVDTENQA